VQFRVDGVTLGAPVAVVGGQATSASVPGMDPGHHTISIVSTGDANFRSSTASYDQVVDKVPSSITVTASPNPVLFGSQTTLTATVTGAASGTPTGTVTFKDGATVLGTSPVATVGGAQKASLAISTLAAGAHSITATYSGDVRFASSTTASALTVTVGAAPTTITTTPAVLSVRAILVLGVLVPTLAYDARLLAPLSATLVSNGAGVPGQTVTFTAGTTVLCTATTNAAGTAFCNQIQLPGLLSILLNGGYRATSTATPSYQSSTAPGPLTTVLVNP
jgi:hypothetical protein